MRCQLKTTCENDGVAKLTINDWRTGFVEKTLQACQACQDAQPALLADHEAWEKRMKEEGT